MLPVSILIMTDNEEQNINYALDSVVDDFEQVIVTDSFSDDRTQQICRDYRQVDLYEHLFESWAEQRNWMLQNCAIRNDIIFFLDADEFITKDFVAELDDILQSGKKFSALYVKIKYIFLDRHLKYAYDHPEIRRIFRHKNLFFIGEGSREYACVTPNTIRMQNHIIHHDHRPLSHWIFKHNMNSDREAMVYFQKAEKIDVVNSEKIPGLLKIKRWIRMQVWDRLPLLIRPPAYFLYRYMIRGGFLDGRAGLIYCYLHALWYYSLIDIKIIEMSRKEVG